MLKSAISSISVLAQWLEISGKVFAVASDGMIARNRARAVRMAIGFLFFRRVLGSFMICSFVFLN